MTAADQYLADMADLQQRLTPRGLIVPPAQGDTNTRPFDVQGSVAFPAPPPILGTVVLSYLCPPGWDGEVTHLSYNLAGGGFNQGSGDVVARIVIDGAAVKGYDTILTELGSPQTPRPSNGIRIHSGQLLQLIVDNNTLNIGGAFLIGAFIGRLWQKGA